MGMKNSTHLAPQGMLAELTREQILEKFNVNNETERLDLRNKNITFIPESIVTLENLTWLNLPNNRVAELPMFIGDIVNLVLLRISNNLITELPDSIGKLENLTVLDISKNSIGDIPNSIGNLGYLKDLNLSNNIITNLPHELGNLTTLKSLILFTNRLDDLPLLENLNSLSMLDCSHNLFQFIPKTIVNFTNLTVLNFVGNRLEIIDGYVLSQLENLTTLDLRINFIEIIPEEVGLMKNLRFMKLRFNKISSLPDTISEMDCLEELEIGENDLYCLPESIGNCKSLKGLFLYSNKLEELPESLSEMTSLAEIFVNMNKITTIPEGLSNLENLTMLNLSYNLLEIIPDGTFSGMRNLKELHLFGNNLHELPTSINYLVECNKIIVSKNKLTSLPTMEQCTALRSLELACNDLNEIPESIFAIRSLEIMNLFGNNISDIPDQIGDFPGLRTLHLGYNNIQHLPDSFVQLSTLVHLSLSGNELEEIPMVIYNILTLEELSLSNNNIENISDDISKLVNLKCLSLDTNSIQEICLGLCEIEALTDLNLSQNQITMIPLQFSQLINLVDVDLSGNFINLVPSLIKCACLDQFKISCNDLKVSPKCDENTWICWASNPGFNVSGKGKKKNLKKPDSTLGGQEFRKYVGWSEMCGRRPDQQDTIVIDLKFNQNPNRILLCCFDGHSGEKTSELAALMVPEILATEMERFGNRKLDEIELDKFIECFTDTFGSVHETSFLNGYDDGTAALCVLLDLVDRQIIVANSGDERAVLCRNGKALQLSIDHKPDEPSEMERIYSENGFVTDNKRVNGILATSRAIGDHDLQPYVTYHPELFKYDIEENDDFIIVACDGLWDLVSNDEAIDIVLNTESASQAATALRDYSYFLGSTDNISVIVYFIPKQPFSETKKLKKKIKEKNN